MGRAKKIGRGSPMPRDSHGCLLHWLVLFLNRVLDVWMVVDISERSGAADQGHVRALRS